MGSDDSAAGPATSRSISGVKRSANEAASERSSCRAPRTITRHQSVTQNCRVFITPLLATLAHWKLNPRRWLTWYLESGAVAGGKAPADIEPFLPRNLSAERRAALAMRPTTPAAPNTS